MQRHSLEIAFEYKSKVSYATSLIRNDLEYKMNLDFKRIIQFFGRGCCCRFS
jgi:hypothetical protein